MRRGMGISLALYCVLCGSARGAEQIEKEFDGRAPKLKAIEVEFDSASGRTGAFLIRGLSKLELAGLRDPEAGMDRLTEVFSLYSASETGPAMLGRYSVEEGAFVFRPRFPLKPGLVYTAVVRRAGSATMKMKFPIPEAPAGEPARITEVYPTADRLPENLLKFYLHFSAPMSRGDSYRFLHLVEEGGREVEYPFLELGEELWNEAGTRLTVFFDPGRIKRGLRPREEVGPALEEGKRYILRIDREWPDTTGRPLERGFEKRFEVAAPDDVQPDPKSWKITAPPADSMEPLVVTFGEPLDHAMLHRVLRVRREEGVLAGRIEVSGKETRWAFVPQAPWAGDDYLLLAEATLEDLAGNSIGRPFEVDVVRPIEQSVELREVAIPFSIGEK